MMFSRCVWLSAGSIVVTITTPGIPAGILGAEEEPPKSHNRKKITVNPLTMYVPIVFQFRSWKFDEERVGVKAVGFEDFRGYGNCMPGIAQRERGCLWLVVRLL